MNAIYDLLDEVKEYPGLSPSYVDKMLHRVPDAQVRDRGEYILEQAKGKVVLDIGCTGPLAAAILEVAVDYWGIDKMPDPGIDHYFQIDLDTVNPERDPLPTIPGLELIIAGELIEHLSNPGNFLELINWFYSDVPLIITTPNAFGQQARLKQGVESVNKDHVAWYSWKTLTTLVERHGWNVVEWYWYNGKPLTAEGLIFKLEPKDG